jgi:CHAT domain-containing protein
MQWASLVACWFALLAATPGQVAGNSQSQATGSTEQFATRIEKIQAEFELAETPQAYREVRDHALLLLAGADKSNQAGVAFAAAVLAANCTYFTIPAGQRSQDKRWVMIELSDLATAARHIGTSPDLLWFERYVNLLAASVDHIDSGVLPRIDKSIEDLLRLLAKSSEQTIPPDFHYRATRRRGQGSEEDIQTGKSLARLSQRHGSPSVARARLLEAAHLAAHGEAELWLDIEHERYMNERQANPPGIPLEQLRSEARGGAQGLRELYSSRAGRIWVNSMFDQTYGQMLQDQLSSNDPGTAAEIFKACETLKARTLLDELSARPAELSSTVATEAESLESRVLGFAAGNVSEGEMLQEELNLLSQLLPFGPLGDLEGERQRPLAQLEQIYQKAAAGLDQSAKPAALEQVQRALQPKEVILEYVIPFDEFFRDQNLWILLITKGDFRMAHVSLDQVLPRNSTNSIGISVDGKAPIQASPLSVAVATLRVGIRKDDDRSTRSYLKLFHQVLIQPLMNLGFRPADFERLIIVPHGPLHYLPFAALMDSDGKFLIQKSAVSIAPSASIWLLLTARTGIARHFVGFGNPLLNRPDLPSLDSSETEVLQIAKSIGLGEKDEDVYIHEQASSERFLSQAPRGHLLHVATHGEFPDENALDHHGILLAPTDKKDGTVRASAVRKLDLRSTLLVMLSVCNGGLYRIGPADEPYGLMPAFLQAGSQNVVGTLWKVEDSYGRLLATEFYKNLKSGPAEALRQASLVLIGQDQTVRRWASFVSVGPGRPFPVGEGEVEELQGCRVQHPSGWPTSRELLH